MTGHGQPWRLLLAAALVAATAAACSGTSEGTAAPDAAGPWASDVPLAASSLPAPWLSVPSEDPTDLPRAIPRPQSIPIPVPPPTPAPEPEPTTEAAPATPVGAATMAASVPTRLRIPSIGVDTDLMDLGLQADGTLQVPPSGFPAGWYTGAPTPGELGPAILAGHVDWNRKPGVFFDLRELSPGDEISVLRADGSTARFSVTRVESFGKGGFPTEAVYGDLDHAGLRLITCDGEFDHERRSYRDNLIVFAELI